MAPGRSREHGRSLLDNDEWRKQPEKPVPHDPQPAALLPLHGKDDELWIWRCHIDTSEPHPDAWAFLRDLLVC